MTKALYLPGANRTAHWHAPKFDGRIFTTLEKILLHSTETPKTSGCPGYNYGKAAPTLTINPWPGYQRAWQHFPLTESARALVNPTSTTVSENKDNVCQIEIIGYSDKGHGVPRGCYLPDLPDAGLDYLADALAFIAREWDVPNVWASPWPTYPASYGNSPARMTSSEYDRFRGFLGHLHASGNTHGDPTIDVAGLKARVAARLDGTPAAARTVLRPGDRGDDVKALQLLLIKAGAAIEADGSYGPATEAAVKAYQTAKGLEVDGIAGPATHAALKATAPPTPVPVPTTSKEPAMVLVQVDGLPEVYVSNGITRRHIPDPVALADLQRAIRDQGGTGRVTEVATVAHLDAAYGRLESASTEGNQPATTGA